MWPTAVPRGSPQATDLSAIPTSWLSILLNQESSIRDIEKNRGFYLQQRFRCPIKVAVYLEELSKFKNQYFCKIRVSRRMFCFPFFSDCKMVCSYKVHSSVCAFFRMQSTHIL